MLVNAAGPWVENVLSVGSGVQSKVKVRLVQGSHIVVRKLYDHDRAYIFQNADGRIVFAIPYQDEFTLIGTTDRDYEGDPAKVTASAEEIAYLCEAVSAYLAKPVTPADVVWTFSGVRPLYDDGASDAKAATREYVFELDRPNDGAPLLSIFGGKITTYRRLAEEALEKLAPFLRGAAAREGWTATCAAAGRRFRRVRSRRRRSTTLRRDYPFLGAAHARRLVGAYGTRARTMLGNAGAMADLGRAFGATLTERELRYLVAQEWATTAEDVVWRRSKLGLRLSTEEIAAIESWMVEQRNGAAAPRKAGGVA